MDLNKTQAQFDKYANKVFPESRRDPILYRAMLLCYLQGALNTVRDIREQWNKIGEKTIQP